MIYELIKDIFIHPIDSIFIIINLSLMEIILSVDNSIILSSIIIKNLNKRSDRNKAIKYGIIGAYFFRSISLLFTSFLIKIWWLEFIGGLYLILIGLTFFIKKIKNYTNKKTNKKKYNKNKYSFWKVVFIVEMIDLSFSIDNILASISLSKNILLIFFGVFIGIYFIRLSTKYIINMIEKFPILNYSAFIVIIILGIKLIFSFLNKEFLLGKNLIFLNKIINKFSSFFTLIIFFFPLFIKIMNKKFFRKIK